MYAASRQVEHPCQWNRYCSFIGSFYPEHLLEVGKVAPQVVGRCYVCGGYVCNRCARRSPFENEGFASALSVSELFCPMDGTPLGRGDDFVIFSLYGSSVRRSTGRPDARVLYEAVLENLDDETLIYAGREVSDAYDAEGMSAIRESLSSALRHLEQEESAAAIEECDRVLREIPDHALALSLKRTALERLERFREAWEALRTLLYLDESKILRALVELKRLAQESGQNREERLKDFFALLAVSAQAKNFVSLSPAADSQAGAIIESSSEATATDARLPVWVSRPAFGQNLTGIPDVHLKARSLIRLDFGQVIVESCPPTAHTTLIIFCHEYGSTDQQKNLYQLLEHLLHEAAETPILIEGSEVERPASRAAIKNREQRVVRSRAILDEASSSATEVLAEFYPAPRVIRGVDDTALLDTQRAKHRLIETKLNSADPFVLALTHLGINPFASVLGDFEADVVSARAAELRLMRSEFERTGATSRHLKNLVPLIKETGLSVEAYPSAHALLTAIKLEGELDFDDVERERMALVEQLSDYSVAPLSEAQLRALSRWVAEAPPEEQTLRHAYEDVLVAAGVQPSAPPPRKESKGFFSRLWPFGSKQESTVDDSLPSAPDWFERLLVLSLALRDNKVSKSLYYTRLDSLLNCFGTQPSTLLRQYIDYMLLADQVDANALALVELPAIEDQLHERLLTSAQEYGALKLSRELPRFKQLLGLKLRAERVEQLLSSPPSAARWLNDAVRLAIYVKASKGDSIENSSSGTAAQFAKLYEDALPDVIDYYSCARKRSRKMSANALDNSFNSAKIRALVCGRFHLHEIFRAAQEHIHLSLLVVAPFPKSSGSNGEITRSAWLSFDEEHTMPLEKS